MYTIRTILHPTDFSKQAERAFQVACALADKHQAKVVVLHVGPLPLTSLGGAQAVPPLPEELGREELKQALLRVRSPLPNVRIEHRLELGEAATEILRIAEKDKADLIVLGTHGRSGLERVLIGSVAEDVLRRAQCPVLTWK